jgi:hypothetical protein
VVGTRRKTTTRREFVIDVGCGFCGGALFGLGFTIADRWLRHPRIVLVGTGDSQVALLLTSSSRVLVALGPWRVELIDALLPILGWSDRRIDLVLAAASETVQARAWFSHQTIARRLALVASDQPTEAPMPDELIDRPMEVRIDGDTRLTIEPSHDYGHPNGETSRSPWVALVQRGRNQIWLAERASGLDLIVPF